MVWGTTTNSQVREPVMPEGSVLRSVFVCGGKTLAPGTLTSGARSIHFRLPLPSTLKRRVAASPRASAWWSTAAEALNRPTAPLKPGSSGIGLASIVIGRVERCTTAPLSKKPWRGIAIFRVAAGMVRRPARVGKRSFTRIGKRR